MLMNRTPRSTIRRASKQARANDGLAGSTPYMSSVACDSLLQIHQLRRRGLQAKGHLVRGDARGDFGIADRFQPLAIQIADQVERVALGAGVDARPGWRHRESDRLDCESGRRNRRSAETRSTSWPRRR